MHMAIFQKIERTNVSQYGVGLLQDDFYNENRPVIPALVSAGQLSFLLYQLQGKGTPVNEYMPPRKKSHISNASNNMNIRILKTASSVIISFALPILSHLSSIKSVLFQINISVKKILFVFCSRIYFFFMIKTREKSDPEPWNCPCSLLVVSDCLRGCCKNTAHGVIDARGFFRVKIFKEPC